ncbi:acyl-CoA dehydrogenase [Solimonas sp. K1W22B-7]|uniref:acyl-CoA dehydrogenase family protein n=1 Tax=Solimonas sp. K1W22B-7 TaxID=2303331 RepID=UPI000E3315C5|nr:acyl-CoA dehydrogenase family protein [Solimonas sp. K1W22B-7]AXQ27828.1 acyl-CoA dehydrogenase [Solimonas sp. K1W22B-7]
MAFADSNSAELSSWRDTVIRFLADEVEPHYEKWEKAGIVPRELYIKFGEAGLLCVDLPEEYGGSAAPLAFSFAIAEESARLGYMSLTSNMMMHSDIVAPYILHLGSEAQKQKYLPRMVSGECFGALAMSEPGTGSDLQAIRSSATPHGDGWRLNGSKTFITNGQHAGVVIVAAKTDTKAGAKGVTLFLVDTELPGFRRGRNLEKIGMHAADTSELFFDDVPLGPDAVLGRIGNGFGHLIDELPRERLMLAVAAVAHAEGALERTVEYVKSRKAFGQAISSFQNTRFELAKVKAEIEVTRAFYEKCCRLYEQGKLDVPTAAILKLSSSEMEGRVVDACLQLFGGYGYMAEYPISRYWTDARVQRIYGGTNEIMKEVIARSLVGR